MTTVSVIVPVFNPGDSITPLLDSLLGQTMPPGECELIFVDDGSTDGSGARLDGLTRAHAHVQVEHIPNSGWPGRPRNVGLDLASGEFVYFVDNDDWLGREALDRLCATARGDDADVVIGKVVGHGKLVPRGVFIRNEHDLDVRSVSFSLLSPSKLFRRAMLVEHGIRFPEGKCRLEDHAFVVTAFFAARRIAILADYPCYHWVRRDDQSNASLQTHDWAEYYDGVRHALDVVDAHTEPGPFRDRLAMRWYRGKVLGRVKGYFPERPDEQRSALFEEAKKVVEERFPPRLDEHLHHADRVRARMLRLGDLGGVEALARYERRLRGVARVKRIRGDGTWLTLDIRAHLGHADDEPLRLLRRDGTLAWSAPDVLRPHLAAEDLTIAGPLAAESTRVLLLSDEDGTEWDLDASVSVSVPAAADGEPVRPRLKLRARIAPTVAAGGGPLPAGEYHVQAVVSLIGFQSVVPVRGKQESLTIRVTDGCRVVSSLPPEPPPPPPPPTRPRPAGARFAKRVPYLLPALRRARRAIAR